MKKHPVPVAAAPARTGPPLQQQNGRKAALRSLAPGCQSGGGDTRTPGGSGSRFNVGQAATWASRAPTLPASLQLTLRLFVVLRLADHNSPSTGCIGCAAPCPKRRCSAKRDSARPHSGHRRLQCRVARTDGNEGTTMAMRIQQACQKRDAACTSAPAGTEGRGRGSSKGWAAQVGATGYNTEGNLKSKQFVVHSFIWSRAARAWRVRACCCWPTWHRRPSAARIRPCCMGAQLPSCTTRSSKRGQPDAGCRGNAISSDLPADWAQCGIVPLRGAVLPPKKDDLH